MSVGLIVALTVLMHAGFGGVRVVMLLYAIDQGAQPLIVGLLLSLYALVPMFLSSIVLALPAPNSVDPAS